MNFSAPSIHAPERHIIDRCIKKWNLFFHLLHLGWPHDLLWPMGYWRMWHKERLQKHLCIGACHRLFLLKTYLPLYKHVLAWEPHDPVSPVATATAIQTLETQLLADGEPTAEVRGSPAETNRRTCPAEPRPSYRLVSHVNGWCVKPLTMFWSGLLCSSG